MEKDRILSEDKAGGSGSVRGVGARPRRAKKLLTGLAMIGLLGLPGGGAATGWAAVFGSEPGGRTVGGPAQAKIKSGSSRELLTFLHRGPTPFRFICMTGMNEGPATLTVVFRSRIGETTTARLSQGETRVVCGETTGVEVECHAQGGDCTFRWRIDEPR